MSNFKKLYEDAELPIRGTKKSAGYDLFSRERVTIEPMQRALVKTGVTIEMEDNEYLAIVPRSGLAYKQGITVLNAPGTIDADYAPGEIGVILFNSSNNFVEIEVGDRIAQGILQEYKIMGVDNVKEDTRDGGFGSTGVQ